MVRPPSGLEPLPRCLTTGGSPPRRWAGVGKGTNTFDSHSRASETEQLSNSPSSTASSHVKRNLLNGFGKFDGSMLAENTVIRM